MPLTGITKLSCQISAGNEESWLCCGWCRTVRKKSVLIKVPVSKENSSFIRVRLIHILHIQWRQGGIWFQWFGMQMHMAS